MKILSLFSGCGGIDLGFLKAGAEIVWANDIDKDAVMTYKHNFKEKNIICKDIYDLKPNECPNDIDLIVGGFPCLGFTVAKGKSRNINDKHNILYQQYIKILEDKLPKYFLVENVPGMKSGEDFNTFYRQMIIDFENAGIKNGGAGYRVKEKILLASDYGVPQNRKRLILIGTRNDIEIEPSFPIPTHTKNPLKDKNLLPHITLKEAISDLPRHYSEEVINHIGTKHKVKINGYVGNRQLDWEKPSPTITGRGSRTGGAVIHPHPNRERRLSVRECARIQTFPDDFVFTGSNGANFAHIGNAVPPILAFHIAKEFRKVIDGEEINFNPKDWKLPWLT
jgi:DNA (cytosine-5)-methyltransferase 1